MPIKPPLWERIVDALLSPFRLLSGLSGWVEWFVDRVLVVPFSVLSEISIWFVWGLERTLLAPVHALTRLAVWIGETWGREGQIDEGFKPLWQRMLILSYNLAINTVYLVWRILSSPFRRRIDQE